MFRVWSRYGDGGLSWPPSPDGLNWSGVEPLVLLTHPPRLQNKDQHTTAFWFWEVFLIILKTNTPPLRTEMHSNPEDRVPRRSASSQRRWVQRFRLGAAGSRERWSLGSGSPGQPDPSRCIKPVSPTAPAPPRDEDRTWRCSAALSPISK